MDVPVEPPEGKHSLDQDIPALRGVADLYVQAKALILYSEEVDPESRSNLQVIKELRDAFDHLMRVIVARLGSDAPRRGRSRVLFKEHPKGHRPYLPGSVRRPGWHRSGLLVALASFFWLGGQ